MINEEISQFVNAFEDFMKHTKMENFNLHKCSEHDQYQKESKDMIEKEIKKKAEKLQITYDYYIYEFI
jgi:hypothetical protein